ncbi:MAG: DUF6882 domain-containing protein, partial [Bacteroidota bacterium]
QWEVDQARGTIIWVFSDGVRGEAPVKIVGSYNVQQGDWLWGWANQSLRPDLRIDDAVREWGQENEVAPFTEASAACEVETARAWAALAAELTDANGLYYARSGPMVIFMTFGTVTLSRPGSPESPEIRVTPENLLSADAAAPLLDFLADHFHRQRIAQTTLPGATRIDWTQTALHQVYAQDAGQFLVEFDYRGGEQTDQYRYVVEAIEGGYRIVEELEL